MNNSDRDALLTEMCAELDMPPSMVGALLDEAARLEVDLADWARYDELPAGVPPWPWHPQEALYHGGQAGLRVGQLILPPTATGVQPADQRATYAPGTYRADRVYMTTDPEAARLFAALHPSGTAKRGGDVYRVQPLQGLTSDRDCKMPGMSWEAPCARIIGIHATSIRRAPYTNALIDQKKEEPRRPLRAFTWQPHGTTRAT